MRLVTAALAAFMLIFAFAATPASAGHGTSFRSDICVDTENGEACLETKSGNPIGAICFQVGSQKCCKQVVVTSKSKGGKACKECECDFEDTVKQDKCLTKCEKKNEGCNGGSSSAKLTEVGDSMSCVLND